MEVTASALPFPPPPRHCPLPVLPGQSGKWALLWAELLASAVWEGGLEVRSLIVKVLAKPILSRGSGGNMFHGLL